MLGPNLGPGRIHMASQGHSWTLPGEMKHAAFTVVLFTNTGLNSTLILWHTGSWNVPGINDKRAARFRQVFSSASMDLNDLFNKTIIHLLPGMIVFLLRGESNFTLLLCGNVQCVLVFVVRFHNNGSSSHLMHIFMSRQPSRPLSGALIKCVRVSIAQGIQLHFKFDHIKVRIPDGLGRSAIVPLPLWLQVQRPKCPKH